MASDEDSNDNQATITEADVKPSIALRLIRHAESRNNEVYRNARYIYRGGTPDYDEEGWIDYVETHRKADPALSDKGSQQAKLLAEYLIPHIENQASHPIRIITSPMRRTLETIRPTLEGLQKRVVHGDCHAKVHIIVCAFYHESEGCHLKDTPEEGMNPQEIQELLKDCVQDTKRDLEFVGFPNPNRGWYVEGIGPESRAQSEVRAAKFYLWLNTYLDTQLEVKDYDLFDAGVSIEGEEHEDENDKLSKRIRRRRTALLIGHGDFMSLVLKRLISGYGHYVERPGISHRSAFVHFNTGISDLEYFGHGRFLLMATNQTPHIPLSSEFASLRSGGGLKDGWSYVMPSDKFVLNAEVAVAFSDEKLEDHVLEQVTALKDLYLSSQVYEKEDRLQGNNNGKSKRDVHFMVKRGLQVVGVATYCDDTGVLSDVAIRPSIEADQIQSTLLHSIAKHVKKIGRSNKIFVFPNSLKSRDFFKAMGFIEEDGRMIAFID